MSILIDSGASDHVLPSKQCEDVPLQPTAKSRSGYEYETAAGKTVVNEGERDVMFATREGNLSRLPFQVADICQGLGSVKQLVEDGMEVTFKKGGAFILHPGGERTWLRKQNGLWYLDMWKVSHSAREAVLKAFNSRQPFQRQG